MIMSPEHPRWFQFYETLAQLKCCDHSHDRTMAVLQNDFPDCDTRETVAFFCKNGGYCDCEVLFNVGASWAHKHGLCEYCLKRDAITRGMCEACAIKYRGPQ
jgi:hypothetical protein